MSKRPAYEAEIDDSDDTLHVKRAKAGTSVDDRDSHFIGSRYEMNHIIRRCLDSKIPSPQMGSAAVLTQLVFSGGLIKITWNPVSHFMRQEKEWQQIIMLVMLHHHHKLPVPDTGLREIIRWTVALSKGVCC